MTDIHTQVCSWCGRDGSLWMGVCQDCTYKELERARKSAEHA